MSPQNRDEFPDLCVERGITKIVEIGCERGLYAEVFAKCPFIEQILCVDDYRFHGENPYDRTADIIMAATRLGPYRKVQIAQMTSVAAADCILNGTAFKHMKGFGFVYIDADHEYESVRRDIIAWWDLLPSGGILAGHDYDETHPGIIKAVNWQVGCFTPALRLNLTSEPLPSWWMVKP